MGMGGNVADSNNLDIPINVGESVSNTHILRAISDLRFHVDYRMGEMREMNRSDSERGELVQRYSWSKNSILYAFISLLCSLSLICPKSVASCTAGTG